VFSECGLWSDSGLVDDLFLLVDVDELCKDQDEGLEDLSPFGARSLTDPKHIH